MDSNIGLEKVQMEIKVEELVGESKEKEVSIIIEDLDWLRINLSNSNVADIKKLFDKVFEYIIINKKIIVFVLEETGNSLFYEVTNDLVEHLNNEIEQSEENFVQFIQMQEKLAQ